MCHCQDRGPKVDISNVIIVFDFQIVFSLIFHVLFALLPPSTMLFQFFLFFNALFKPLAEDNETSYIPEAHTAVIFIFLEVSMACQ